MAVRSEQNRQSSSGLPRAMLTAFIWIAGAWLVMWLCMIMAIAYLFAQVSAAREGVRQNWQLIQTEALKREKLESQHHQKPTQED